MLTDNEGWFVIDRCGKHFGTILNFLRDGAIAMPDCRVEIQELLQEAKYYLIQVRPGRYCFDFSIKDLVLLCVNWLDAARTEDAEPPGVFCKIPTISTKVRLFLLWRSLR